MFRLSSFYHALMKHLVILLLSCFAAHYIYAFGGVGVTDGRTRPVLEMKGKGSRVPIDKRGEFVKREKMMEEMAKLEKNKPAGVPMFKIFVRPQTGGLWVPCGELAGDKRATALVNAWLSGFLTDMYRSQLDKGIAKSIFQQEDMFVRQVTTNIRPFKKMSKDQLQFGYQVQYPGIEEKYGEQNITALVKGMEKTWLDNAKDSLTNLFSGKSESQ